MPRHSDGPSPPPSTKSREQSENSPPLAQPIFLRKPVRPVIDKTILAAFLGQTSSEEKEELIQDRSDSTVKLWTRCQYCEVYLKLSNLEKHFGKCCVKWGMIIKK